MGSQSVRHNWATKPATETPVPRQSPKTGIPACLSGADWDCGARGGCPGRGTCSQKVGVLGCGLCLPGETTQWPLLQSSALTHPLHFDLMAHLPGSEKCGREACLLNRGLGKRRKKKSPTKKFKPQFCMLACGLSLYFLWMWVLTETSTGELVSGLLKPLVSWAGERKKTALDFLQLGSQENSSAWTTTVEGVDTVSNFSHLRKEINHECKAGNLANPRQTSKV